MNLTVQVMLAILTLSIDRFLRQEVKKYEEAINSNHYYISSINCVYFMC